MFAKLRAWLSGRRVQQVDPQVVIKKNIEELKTETVDTQTKIKTAIEFLENNKDKDCTVNILVPKQVKQIPYDDVSFLEQMKINIVSKGGCLTADKHLFTNADTWIKIYDNLLIAVDEVRTVAGVVLVEQSSLPVQTNPDADIFGKPRKLSSEELVEKKQELVSVLAKRFEECYNENPSEPACPCRVIGPGTFPSDDPDGSKARAEFEKNGILSGFNNPHDPFGVSKIISAPVIPVEVTSPGMLIEQGYNSAIVPIPNISSDEEVVESDDISHETLGARELKNTTSSIEDEEVIDKHICVYETDKPQVVISRPPAIQLTDNWAGIHSTPVTPIPSSSYTPPVYATTIPTPALTGVCSPVQLEVGEEIVDTTEDVVSNTSSARELKNTTTTMEDEEEVIEG